MKKKKTERYMERHPRGGRMAGRRVTHTHILCFSDRQPGGCNKLCQISNFSPPVAKQREFCRFHYFCVKKYAKPSTTEICRFIQVANLASLGFPSSTTGQTIYKLYQISNFSPSAAQQWGFCRFH